ncbi:MAG: hypothetical protein PHH77_10970 [Victivallaceae bacterium]|nr:hypothetical protein [Victivallaceae bacterium]
MNPIVLHTQRKKRLQLGGYNWYRLGFSHSSSVGLVCNMLMTDDFSKTDDVTVALSNIYCGYHNGSRYIIGGKKSSGDNFLMISEDGAYWEPVPVPDFEYVMSIGWNGSYWLISGSNSAYEGIISWSADGESWSIPTVVGAASSSAGKIINNNTHWFIRTYNDGIIKVPFATADWGNITHFNPGLNEIGTIECNASHMLVGNGSIFNGEPTIRYSTDFTNWLTAVYPSQFLAVDSFCRLGSLWFAGAHTDNPVSYALLKSTDGINFSEITVDSENDLRAMEIFSDGAKLVMETAITTNPYQYLVYTSDNAGATWTRHDFAYRPTFASIVFCMPKYDPDGIPPIT